MAQRVIADEGTQLELTLYGWSFGVGGDAAIGTRTVPLDFSLGDAFKFDNIGASALLELRERAFTLMVSGAYVGVTADSGSVRFDTDQYMLDGFLGYRLASQLDVLAGGRFFDVSAKMTEDADVDTHDQNWLDFVAGLRYEWGLSDKWLLRTKGDIGFSTSGNSSNWSLGATGFYKFSGKFAVALSYQVASVRYEEGSGPNRFLYDLTFAGPGLGLMFYAY